MRKGLFIVFEGIDGSGTTTQAERLQRRIQSLGYPVLYTREPGGTTLGEKLRSLLLDPALNIHALAETLLYAACRAQHVREVILPALKAGTAVVGDRYLASSLAYQGFGRGVGWETVWQFNKQAVNNCLPDVTIFLDLPLAEARQRRKDRGKSPDRLELEGDLFQEKVRWAYQEIARRQGAAAIVLDARKERELLADEIWDYLQKRWPHFPRRQAPS